VNRTWINWYTIDRKLVKPVPVWDPARDNTTASELVQSLEDDCDGKNESHQDEAMSQGDLVEDNESDSDSDDDDHYYEEEGPTYGHSSLERLYMAVGYLYISPSISQHSRR